jgi:aminoglycoside/choline kinase family phosphotransferase
MRQAVDWLASFHAIWWNHPQLAAWKSGLRPLQGMDENISKTSQIKRLWNAVDGRFGEREKCLCQEIGSRWPALIESQADSPYTLCHGDFHPMNMFVPEFPARRSMHVIDWQFCYIGVGISDLADYLGLFVHPQLRREWEGELIRRYWKGLLAHGVTHYSLEDCIRDYRTEIAKNLLMPLFQMRIPNLPLAGVVQCQRNAILAFDDVVGRTR